MVDASQLLSARLRNDEPLEFLEKHNLLEIITSDEEYMDYFCSKFEIWQTEIMKLKTGALRFRRTTFSYWLNVFFSEIWLQLGDEQLYFTSRVHAELRDYSNEFEDIIKWMSFYTIMKCLKDKHMNIKDRLVIECD